MPLPPLSGGMGLTLPTPGGDTGVWDDELNDALTTVNDHDHTTGNGDPITVDALSINKDLSFGSHSATHLASADFDTIATPTTGARRLYWGSSDGELYARDSNGINVKLTSGGTINLTLAGGIVGDYAAVGAQVDYDDANDRYRFRQQLSSAVRQWARLDSADLDLYEYHPAGNVTNVTNRVRLSSPASLAASYTLTLPAAVPTASSPLVVSAAGVTSYAETAVRTLMIAPQTATDTAGGSYTRATSTSGGFTHWITTATTNTLVIPIPVNVGDIITGYTLYCKKRTDNTHTIAAQLFLADSTIFGESPQGAGSSNAGNATGSVTLTESALTVTITATAFAYIVFTPSGSVTPNADEVWGCKVTFKRAL